MFNKKTAKEELFMLFNPFNLIIENYLMTLKVVILCYLYNHAASILIKLFCFN